MTTIAAQDDWVTQAFGIDPRRYAASPQPTLAVALVWFINAQAWQQSAPHNPTAAQSLAAADAAAAAATIPSRSGIMR